MTTSKKSLEIAQKAFADIQARFPHLEMDVDATAPVDFAVTFPVQTGLKYKVNLSLQNQDELHFSASHFLLEWFPCTVPDRVDEYIAAVCGFLSGEFKIVEHYHGDKCVRAELQAPKDGAWTTIGTWSSPGALFPVKKRLVVAQNI